MRVRLRVAWGESSDQVVMKMAAWSAVAHVVLVVVFTLLPRFGSQTPPPRATVAEIVPASALFSSTPAGRPDAARSGPTPSERAEAARNAAEPKAAPPLTHKQEPVKPAKVKPSPAPVPPRPSPAQEHRDEERRDHDEPAEEPEPAQQSEPPAGSSGDAGISFGGGSGPGGIPSIGSSAFPYDYYRSSLVAILQSNWRRPVAPEGLRQTVTCRVQFTILKSGIVQDARISQPSGNEALDQSALRAVYNSNPLPPLPFQYGQSSVSAEVMFELTPD